MTNDTHIIQTVKANLTRTHYKLMWGRMRDSDTFSDSSPSVCTITKELPALVCGSDWSHTQAHGRKSPASKHNNVAAKSQSSKKTAGSVNTTASGEDSGQGDDDGGGGDGDPDGPYAIATLPFIRHNDLSESIPPQSAVGLLRLPQVLNIFPVSKSTWWSGVKTGRYPAPVKPSRRTTAWRHSDIMKLIESLADEPATRAAQEALQ